MKPGAWAIVSVEQMRVLEARAFQTGIPEAELQARAAEQIALVAATLAPPTSLVVTLVGPGNNGRDAFLAGRLLARRGRRMAYYLTPRHAITFEELRELDPHVERAIVYGEDGSLHRLTVALEDASLAVDGLLGIGVRGPMRTPLSDLAETLNKARRASAELKVLAVDVPSGIDAESGAIPGVAVAADVTVALGGVKAGCLRFPAAALTGRLEPRPIGLPAGADADCTVRLVRTEEARGLAPGRPLDAHKGSLGWVLVVGGSRQYIGAPILTAAAAARSGCGLVGLAVPPSVQGPAAAFLPEATYLLRDPEQAPAVLVERIVERLSDFDVLILGPGLGRDAAATALVRGLLAHPQLAGENMPIIVDADALFILAQWERWWEFLPAGCVLTPHHAEMARLAGLTAMQVAAEAWETAQERAVLWGQTIVLKGPHTVIADPVGATWVYGEANPALATAGSGDVLAGLIGGLAAQGLDALTACQLGVVSHALAARNVLHRQAWRTIVASDLLPALPVVLEQLRC